MGSLLSDFSTIIHLLSDLHQPTRTSLMTPSLTLALSIDLVYILWPLQRLWLLPLHSPLTSHLPSALVNDLVFILCLCQQLCLSPLASPLTSSPSSVLTINFISLLSLSTVTSSSVLVEKIWTLFSTHWCKLYLPTISTITVVTLDLLCDYCQICYIHLCSRLSLMHTYDTSSLWWFFWCQQLLFNIHLPLFSIAKFLYIP